MLQYSQIRFLIWKNVPQYHFMENIFLLLHIRCVVIITQTLSQYKDGLLRYGDFHYKNKTIVRPCYLYNVMMTSSNGNIFRVTGPLCGEFTGPGELPTQRPVMRSFDVFFDLRLNKRLSKQPWGWWFETPVWSLWRHRFGEFRYWWDMLRHPVTFLLHSQKCP